MRLSDLRQAHHILNAAYRVSDTGAKTKQGLPLLEAMSKHRGKLYGVVVHVGKRRIGIHTMYRIKPGG